jgi:peptide/nickel transport system substrate-binding protein
MGFDPDLAPYEYDPDAAKSLLEEAGYGDGIQARLEISSDASQAVGEALIGQWAEVGITVELEVSDLASFNATWTDSEAPQLRMATWSPLFDPSTLLNLVFWSEGVLSRYSNTAADDLIGQGGSLLEEEARREAYIALGHELHTDAAAVFLWNLINVAGVSEKAAAWTPRPDQWLLALAR